MTSETKFNMANSATGNRYSHLIKVYSDAWRAGQSRASIAVALHNSTPNVKHVAYVGGVDGSSTIHIKLHDSSSITIHTYEDPGEYVDVPDKWTAQIGKHEGDLIPPPTEADEQRIAKTMTQIFH